MSFLSPLWGLALASLGVILALYLLKRRYQDYPVASTFLWEKALRDTAASHPFQKLRKNPLLPLQLLLARQTRALIVLISDSLHCGKIPFHSSARSIPTIRSSGAASA